MWFRALGGGWISFVQSISLDTRYPWLITSTAIIMMISIVCVNLFVCAVDSMLNYDSNLCCPTGASRSMSSCLFQLSGIVSPDRWQSLQHSSAPSQSSSIRRGISRVPALGVFGDTSSVCGKHNKNPVNLWDIFACCNEWDLTEHQWDSRFYS